MSFTYNTGVPATNNDPSADQPDMLVNTASVNSIIAVDHVSFNAANGGTHKQVTFSSENVPGAPTDPSSVLYTNAGTLNTRAQLLLRNQSASYLLSCVRAFGVFTVPAAAGNIVPGNQFNVNGNIVYTIGPQTAVITLNTGSVVAGSTNANTIILCRTNSTTVPIVNISGVTLTITNISTGLNVSFVVIQN